MGNFLGILKNLKSTLTTSFPEYCSPGWNYFQGSCYYFSSTPKSWSDSKTDCIGKSASLVNIGSDAENKFVNNQITNNAWLGLKEVSGDRLNWINDGSEPFYAKWKNGQPVYQNGRDDCTFLQLEFWSTKDCSQNLPFVCEKGKLIVLSPSNGLICLVLYSEGFNVWMDF